LAHVSCPRLEKVGKPVIRLMIRRPAVKATVERKDGENYEGQKKNRSWGKSSVQKMIVRMKSFAKGKRP
jgi:hypothetical protein